MATCSPSELLASGACFQCLTKKELQIVIAQLLCEIRAGGGGGGSDPKVYRALLSQSGTDAPVATVLENTLGGVPVWSFVIDGQFDLTLAGAFPVEKTIITSQVDWQNGHGAVLEAGVSVSPNVIRVDSFISMTDPLLRTRIGDNSFFQVLVYP